MQPPLPSRQVDVRVADPASLHFDQDLGRPALRYGHVLNNEGCASFVKDRSFHEEVDG